MVTRGGDLTDDPPWASAAKTAIGLLSAALAVAGLLAACSPAPLGLEEYVELMQSTTDELEAAGVDFSAVVADAIHPDTGLVVNPEAIQQLLDATVTSLGAYLDDLEAVDPPPEVAEAHERFVLVAERRFRQWQDVADRAFEVSSMDELVAVTLKSPEFTRACVSLEEAVFATGERLDLDCD